MYHTVVDDLLAQPVARGRYDLVSTVLHWLAVPLLCLHFWLVRTPPGARDGDHAVRSMGLHWSVGTMAWLLMLSCLVWETDLLNGPAWPPMSASWRLIVQLERSALYALLILLPPACFLQSVVQCKAFLPLLGQIPAVIWREETPRQLFRHLAETEAVAAVALIWCRVLAGLRPDG